MKLITAAGSAAGQLPQGCFPCIGLQSFMAGIQEVERQKMRELEQQVAAMKRPYHTRFLRA